MTWFAKILLGGTLEPDVVIAAERSGFVRVDEPLRQYSSFFIRLVTAAVIATAGVAADSATTIIGAMLVAPLMSPMLGTALAAALGRPLKTLQTFALTLGGMGVVILVAVGVTAIIPVRRRHEHQHAGARAHPRRDSSTSSSRSPRLRAALASVRRDIPDAVPGIAISASIVPPLCVTGAALLEGASAAAWGSFLLFVTNYVAIQVAGAAVYLMAGLGRREFSVIEGRARELWYLGVALMALAVVGSLATTSFGIVRANDELRRAQEAASAWVEGTEYRIARFELEDGELAARDRRGGPRASGGTSRALAEPCRPRAGRAPVAVVAEERIELD